MEAIVKTVLAEYEERAEREFAQMGKLSPAEFGSRLDEFLLPVGPDTGKLMHSLVIGSKAKVIVEIGASYGYSTHWLADAARATGGRVHSLELSSEKADYARSQLRRSGLEAHVEFHIGNALETLRALPGPFDFVLLDLWKDLYVPCFELFHAKLGPNAFVVADNMLFPPNPEGQAAYRQAVRAKGDLESMLLPIGSGLELSKKR
jgi:predicted O-methyltransferase YrrM